MILMHYPMTSSEERQILSLLSTSERLRTVEASRLTTDGLKRLARDVCGEEDAEPFEFGRES